MRLLYETTKPEGGGKREFVTVSEDSLIGRDFAHRPGVVTITYTFKDGSVTVWTHLDREEEVAKGVTGW